MATTVPAGMTQEGVTAAQITALQGRCTSLESATSGLGTLTSNVSSLSSAVTALQAVPAFTAGTPATITSGTTVPFTTGIPSTAKRVSIVFSGVGTGSTSVLQAQVGSGSFSTSGYNGVVNYMGGGALAQANLSSGIPFYNSNAAANRYHGRVTFNLIGSNLWEFDSQVGASNGVYASTAVGSIQLSGALDRIQLTTVNGTDVFAAGTANVTWE